MLLPDADAAGEELGARLAEATDIPSGWLAETTRLTPHLLLGWQLVRWLVVGQIDAIAVSGPDRGLLRGDGGIPQVHRGRLRQLLDLGLLPVLSPLLLGEDGAVHIADAAVVATRVALAVEAQKLVFLDDLPGIRITGRIMRGLSLGQIAGLIGDGYLAGRELEAAQSAVAAIQAGVHQVLITDLAGLARGRGTAIVNG